MLNAPYQHLSCFSFEVFDHARNIILIGIIKRRRIIPRHPDRVKRLEQLRPRLKRKPVSLDTKPGSPKQGFQWRNPIGKTRM
jgi:hypothetical protein